MSRLHQTHQTRMTLISHVTPISNHITYQFHVTWYGCALGVILVRDIYKNEMTWYHALNTMPYPYHANVTAHHSHVTSHHILSIPGTSQFITPISHRHHITSLFRITFKSHLHYVHITYITVTPISRYLTFVSYHNQMTTYNVHIWFITLISHAYHNITWQQTICRPYHLTPHHVRIT